MKLLEKKIIVYPSKDYDYKKLSMTPLFALVL